MSRTDPSSGNIRDARAAGLRYVSALDEGIHRRRRGRGFCYVSAAGKPIRSPAILRRIRSLVIPPAWQEVVICPDPRGHLQAVGRDQRGRRQYKYHPRWREIRDENKFEKMIDFGKALPKIRRQVRRDLKRRGLPRAKIVAVIVRLLDCSHIRIGNEEYARENHSFGLTTMRNRHAHVDASGIHLHFRGKTGIVHAVDVEDPRLAKIVRACQHLPGQELFQYLDDRGAAQPIGSGDVNDYLHQVAGDEFTAKDFRTWNGTVLAATALKKIGRFHSQRQARSNVVRAIESVARELRNTQAVCRKCYIHPTVLSAYSDGALWRLPRHSPTARGLRSEESAVLFLLTGASGS